MGLFDLDEKGFFNPNASVTVACCFNALNLLSKQVLEMDIEEIKAHYNQPIDTLLLTRELLAYFIDVFYRQVLKQKEPIPYFRSGYLPLAPFDAVVDQDRIDPIFYKSVQFVWQLGLMRSEVDVYRGLIAHGLYFIWGLTQDELDESHEIV